MFLQSLGLFEPSTFLSNRGNYLGCHRSLFGALLAVASKFCVREARAPGQTVKETQMPNDVCPRRPSNLQSKIANLRHHREPERTSSSILCAVCVFGSFLRLRLHGLVVPAKVCDSRSELAV